MSILLIGQRTRHRSQLRSPNQPEDYRKDKKHAQQRYRLDLLAQINDKYQRKKKQKQLQIQLDKKYERLFYQQKAHTQSSQLKPFSGFERWEHQTEARAGRRMLPPLDNYLTYKPQPKRLQTQPILPPLYQSNQTQTTTNQAQPTKYHLSHLPQLQNTQERHKKMQEELQSKLQQVYQLMAESVKALHQNEELDSIGSKMTPIRLDLDNSYKVQYPSQVHKSEDNPQEERDYFKLPNIPLNLPEPRRNSRESETEWREWYAKEKLREIEEKYRRQLKVGLEDMRVVNGRSVGLELLGSG